MNSNVLTYWPVIITDTRTAEEALEYTRNHDALYELTGTNETCADAGFEVNAPTAWDRYMVEHDSGFGYPGTPYDEPAATWHARETQARIKAQREACAAAGHPNRRTWSNGKGQSCIDCFDERARADDLSCPAGQHRVLVPGGHRCDSGVVVRGETP